MSLVRSIDIELPESRYAAKPRNIYVKTRKGEITLPQRLITSAEYRAKDGIPSEIPLLDVISSPSVKLIRREIEGILVSNDMASSIYGRYLSVLDGMIHSKVIMPILLFTKNSKDMMKNLSDRKYKKLLELWIHLQLNMGSDVITLLQFYNDSQKKILLDKIKELIKSDKEVSPLIDMSIEHKIFIKFLNDLFILSEEGGIHIINFIYRDFKNYPLNYVALYNSRDKKLIFSMIDSKTKDNFMDASIINYALNTSSDIVGSQIWHAGGSNTHNIKLANVRILNRDRLNLESLGPYMSSRGKEQIIEDIGHKDYVINDALENYLEANSDYEKFKILKNISKIQQFNGSQKELNVERRFIRKGELDEYIEQKDVLKNFLEKRFRPQTKINPLF